jgi:hypothetical protein
VKTLSEDEDDLEDVDYESDFDDNLVDLTDEESIPITMKQIWDCYKPKLLNDYARVAYLLSPHAEIMKHAIDPANRDPLDNIAVETMIEKLLVSHDHENEEEHAQELSDKITTFWSEHSQFVNKQQGVFARKHIWVEQGVFARKHIWVAAANENVLMHEWHSMNSYPFTQVLGPLACIVGSKPLGIGQAERNWKIYKRNKSGQRARLGSGKTKAQTVIAGAYSHQKSAACRGTAQKAGKVWSNEDFVFLKLDSYCTGSITESIIKPVRVVRLYKEAWECNQFDSKGDDIHAARLSAKYGGLKYIDTDEPNNHGVIPSIGG